MPRKPPTYRPPRVAPSYTAGTTQGAGTPAPATATGAPAAVPGIAPPSAPTPVPTPSKPRPTAAQRGYDHRWRALRLSVLADVGRTTFPHGGPTCHHCRTRRGLVVEAKVIDHIIPHRGDYERFNDPANLMSLCKPCHDRKTAREDGAFGNVVLSRPDTRPEAPQS